MSELKKCQYCLKSYPSNEEGKCCPYSYYDKEKNN